MQKRLLDQRAITESHGLPEWARSSYRIFHDKVASRAFPCHFGTVGENGSELRYTFCNRDDLSHLPDTLTEFMEFSRRFPKVRHALIGFFEPELSEQSFQYYQGQFWDVLNFLHVHDKYGWPEDRTTDTSDPLWEFCFGGDAIFLFTGFPAYHRRSSRNFGKGLMILFQPKRVFNGIEGATPGGIRARELIRPRLQAYDGGMPMHPDFNVIDEALAHRWKQYCASDDNSAATGECPFSGSQTGHEAKG